jgi:putative PIN family toxin of toxin-antitoxin system
MIKVFLDANIFFCAVLSSKGGSGFIIKLCQKKQIQCVTSKLALIEAERNISLKLKKTDIKKFHNMLKHLKLIIETEPSRDEIRQANKWVHLKDAPIIACALKSKSDFLITLDRKQLANSVIQEKFPSITILTPHDFINRFLKLD